MLSYPPESILNLFLVTTYQDEIKTHICECLGVGKSHSCSEASDEYPSVITIASLELISIVFPIQLNMLRNPLQASIEPNSSYNNLPQKDQATHKEQHLLNSASLCSSEHKFVQVTEHSLREAELVHDFSHPSCNWVLSQHIEHP